MRFPDVFFCYDWFYFLKSAYLINVACATTSASWFLQPIASKRFCFSSSSNDVMFLEHLMFNTTGNSVVVQLIVCFFPLSAVLLEDVLPETPLGFHRLKSRWALWDCGYCNMYKAVHDIWKMSQAGDSGIYNLFYSLSPIVSVRLMSIFILNYKLNHCTLSAAISSEETACHSSQRPRFHAREHSQTHMQL